MGRIRRDGTTKVWHNPEISSSGRSGNAAAPRATSSPEDRRTANAHRAALEALFSPKKEDDSGKLSKALEAATGKAGRIVLAPPPQADPRAQDRQRLLGKLLHAEGRPAISKAMNEFFKQGFTLPLEQDVYLQLLEHVNEERVREAIAALASILLSELPKRRAVLESRLRRIEEFAEDGTTRTTAAELRRQVTGRGVAASAKAPAAAPALESAAPDMAEAAGVTAVEVDAVGVAVVDAVSVAVVDVDAASVAVVDVDAASMAVVDVDAVSVAVAGIGGTDVDAASVGAGGEETTSDTAEGQSPIPAEVA